MTMIAQTPRPPYYAVIFTSERSDIETGYDEMAERMNQLVAQQDGFLGFESARQALGITVSYWRDLQSINLWKKNLEHQNAKQKGKAEWYKYYKLRISKVEIDY